MADFRDESGVFGPGVRISREPSAERKHAAGPEHTRACLDEAGLIREVFAAFDDPHDIKTLRIELKIVCVSDLEAYT